MATGLMTAGSAATSSIIRFSSARRNVASSAWATRGGRGGGLAVHGGGRLRPQAGGSADSTGRRANAIGDDDDGEEALHEVSGVLLSPAVAVACAANSSSIATAASTIRSPVPISA